MSAPFRGAALLPLCLCSVPVFAEPTIPIDEVVVTGEFRRTRLDELPASVSVVRADEAEARGARHLEDILALTPNVNVASGASRARFFQIRGIGEVGQFTEPLDPSVGLLVDGIDFSDTTAAATLFDIEQIEVFHGPQGTRYGANALAGLINIRTRDPGDTFEARSGMEVGNYDTWTVDGAVSGPLNERVGLRLAAQQHRSDGFIRNSFLGRDDTNKRDERSFRGRLRWFPGSNTTVNTTVGYVDVDNGYDAFSLDNTRTTLSDEPGRDAQRTVFGGANITWNGARAFAVEASVSAASSDSVYGYDEDWTYDGFDPDGYSSTDYYFRDRHNVSGELKLLSGENGRIFGETTDWVAGVYALDRQEKLRREYTFLDDPFFSRFDVRRVAVFGQLQSAIGERNTLTAGARYERHSSEYTDSQALAFSPDDDLIGWRLSFDRHLRQSLVAYASVSRGYKAGGFNTDGSLDPDLRQFDPETLINYEIGLKGEWLEGHLGVRFTAFHMQRNDVQISSSILRERPDGSTEFIDFIGNAAEGTNSGVEADVMFRASEALTLHGSFGWLRSRYESFVNAAGDDLDGREQSHAPGYQFAVRGRYTLPGGWYVEGGAEGRDAFYFSDSHDLRSRPYQLFSAAVGFSRGRWETKLWARNLADKNYTTRGYYFGNDPRNGYADEGYTQPGNPRQFGLSAAWQFQ